ncbi:hypothetical protein TTHERM_00312670 (macronuclear) [Tetrahymena thermophila SB210]|uniref:Uncharacterized protein n=1 Tax=Tetrahymena thermophila (strain SB210) TaxID=312017 RepID=Q22KL4_TETTS|nr:hypothetical protein TTHERM_00312670 [Tetrahymena thermophila SB210]EAR85785.2 hypothetical protein TTHERM_00312670 [Tetrahymena thermophila SB210]|eukprot:XP_001033448.2 hypothetical protein TTHERM_00312670 [Tetrahymena thermophila SB210]
MGKQQNQRQYSAQASESNKKEYTDFEDMKSIFQYTHRRMGLGYSEEQFGESAGVVKGITKKQLVGNDFDAKKKKELEKKKKEREIKSQLVAKEITGKETDNIKENDENNTSKNQQQITESNKNLDDDDFDEKESKTRQIPSKDKKRNFEVEIKTSKKKKAQKAFKIV